MSKLLENRVAIVTGAARGIGLAIARRFHDEGAFVMLADADEDLVIAEAQELDPEGKRAAGFRCDPMKRLDINNLMAATLDAYDRADILVNAVSIEASGDPLDLDEAAFDKALDINVKSAFLLTQLFSRHVIKRVEQRDGDLLPASIINVSAISGERSRPDRFLLSVSMAALDQLTRGFAVSLAAWGIRVNGIAPGNVAGRFTSKGDPEIRKTLVARTPMGRLGETTEVGGAAVMLASELTSYITGQILTVDGGRSIYERPLEAPTEE